MADFTLVDGQTNPSDNTIKVFYTSPSNQGTLIKAFTAYNDTGVNQSFKVFINGSKAIVPLKKLIRNKTYVGSEVIGQEIPPGGTLSMEQSSAGSIHFRVTGELLI